VNDNDTRCSASHANVECTHCRGCKRYSMKFLDNEVVNVSRTVEEWGVRHVG
jgi:hypothetical protein